MAMVLVIFTVSVNLVVVYKQIGTHDVQIGTTGIHRPPVTEDFSKKGQYCGALMLSLLTPNSPVLGVWHAI